MPSVIITHVEEANSTKAEASFSAANKCNKWNLYSITYKCECHLFEQIYKCHLYLFKKGCHLYTSVISVIYSHINDTYTVIFL